LGAFVTYSHRRRPCLDAPIRQSQPRAGELTVLLGFVVFVVVHGVFWISGVISTEIEYRITPEETSGPPDIADNFMTRCMAQPEIIAER